MCFFLFCPYYLPLLVTKKFACIYKIRRKAETTMLSADFCLFYPIFAKKPVISKNCKMSHRRQILSSRIRFLSSKRQNLSSRRLFLKIVKKNQKKFALK